MKVVLICFLCFFSLSLFAQVDDLNPLDTINKKSLIVNHEKDHPKASISLPSKNVILFSPCQEYLLFVMGCSKITESLFVV